MKDVQRTSQWAKENHQDYDDWYIYGLRSCLSQKAARYRLKNAYRNKTRQEEEYPSIISP